MKITNEELTAIRERSEKATRGKWYVSKYGYRVYSNNGAEIGIGGYSAADDAAFIAHARQDIPKLLAEIERLKYALEVIANSDGWLIEPAPLCTVEEAYDRCVEAASEAIYGGDSE